MQNEAWVAAEDEGKQAFKDGVPKDECPHAPFTKAALAWKNGWSLAFGQSDKAKAVIAKEAKRPAVKAHLKTLVPPPPAAEAKAG